MAASRLYLKRLEVRVYGLKFHLKRPIVNGEALEAFEKVREIVEQYTLNSMSDLAKIKVLHDYICNHTNPTIKIPKQYEQTAYGVLILGNGICGGYEEAYALLLDEVEIENTSVCSENHTWNRVLVDEEWYNIDTSWDSAAGSGVDYTWFMKNDQEFYQLSDQKTDRRKNIAHKVTDGVCTSTRYSNVNWYARSE